MWLGLAWLVVFVVDETRRVARTGTTPGHVEAGLEIVDITTGGHPSTGRALARAVVLAPLLYVPPLQLLLGLWVNASSTHRGPHDLVGHTQVVDRHAVQMAAPVLPAPPMWQPATAPAWSTPGTWGPPPGARTPAPGAWPRPGPAGALPPPLRPLRHRLPAHPHRHRRPHLPRRRAPAPGRSDMALPLRDDTPNLAPTWATWGLMLACVVIYLFLQPSPLQQRAGRTIEQRSIAYTQVEHYVDRWGVVPCEVTHQRSIHDGAACNGYPVDEPQNYPAKSVVASLFTAMFLHGSVAHLAGNMLFLWVFGRAVEQRIGHAGLLAFFVAGGLAASIGYIAVKPESVEPLVGASGAIAAVMGAYLVFRPRRRILSVFYAAGLQVVYLPAWAVLGLFLVTQFFTPGSSRVAWQAHVAGMVFGALVALVLTQLHRRAGPAPAL